MKNVFDSVKKYGDVIALLLITGLVFLPYSTSLTYYLDDWYYIYNGIVAGPNIFHAMFSVDRPLRGYFFDGYFSLFGAYPFPYHLGMYVWHAISGIAALSLFNLVWKNNRKINFIAALLFVLYPGFSWWVSGIEYQPIMASLALQILSFFFTIKSIETDTKLYKLIYFSLSVLSGWIYISLVEYAIGMEAMRLFFVFTFLRNQNKDSTSSYLQQSKTWIWSLLIPIGFIFWRFFFFESQRKTTDINAQLSVLISMPMETLQKWGINFLNSFIRINTSWVTQFTHQYKNSQINLSDLNWGIIILIGFLTTVSVIYINQDLFFRVNNKNTPRSHQSSIEMLLIGILGTLIGLLPIIIVNRYVNLTIYSHYGLPISISATLILVGAIHYIVRSPYIQYGLVISLVTLATLSHILIAEKTVFLKNVMEDFWWQAYWRIPNLYPDTTLVTLYPDQRVVDNDIGWAEPVNLIYFPQQQTQIPIRYFVSTLIPSIENIDKIYNQDAKKIDGYRSYEYVLNYQNILILSQPSFLSCVHVIDNIGYIPTKLTPDSIRKISVYSTNKNIRLRDNNFSPPSFAFGEEPPHNWCFYYQKADLALQIGDFAEVYRLSDEALEKDLYPIDKSEWAPFFITYLEEQDSDGLEMVFKDLQLDKELLKEFCLLTSNRPDNSENSKVVINQYCSDN